MDSMNGKDYTGDTLEAYMVGVAEGLRRAREAALLLRPESKADAPETPPKRPRRS